jgi:predicted nucleotidyltransferase
MSADVKDVKLSDLTQAWGIRRLAVFGSCAKGTARQDSDMYLLVEFRNNQKPSLIGHLTLAKLLSERF